MAPQNDTLKHRLKQHPVLIILFVLYLSYLLLAGVVLPQVIKNQIPNWVTQVPKLSAEVSNVSFNPFTLTLTIEHLSIKEQLENTAINLSGAEKITANLELSSIFHQALVLSDVTINKPYGRLTKDSEGGFIWQHWTTSNEETPPKEPNQPFPMIIDQFHIQAGTFDFEDLSKPTEFKKTIGPIDLALNNLSTLPKDEGSYQLDIALTQGDYTAEFLWQGVISLDPFYSEGNLKLTNLSLRSLWDYLQDDVFFEILQGQLTLGFDYQIQKEDQLELILQNGDALVENFMVSKKGETIPLIQLQEQSVSGLSFDLTKQAVYVDQINYNQLNLALNKLSDGKIELVKVLSERPISQAAVKASEKASGKDEWTVSIGKTQLNQSAIRFVDQTTQPAAKLALSDISISVENLTTDKEQSTKISASIMAEGASHLQLNGELALFEQTGNLELDVKSFPVSVLQPYLNKTTELTIENTLFDLNGQLSMLNGVSAFDGSSQIRDIKLSNQSQKQAILAGDGIYLENIQFNQAQKSLSIGEILLDQMLYPLTVLSRQEKSTVTNLSNLVKPNDQSAIKEPTDAPQDASPADDWLVEVGQVSIKNNQLQFSDRGLPKPVYFNIEQLNGSINKLSSKNLSRADVTIAGQVNGYAPFKAVGQINPLSEKAYTNIDINMSGIAMSTFSSYSSYFLNYPTTQGKLSTELNYKLNNNELVAENHLFIDQLELGDYVESDAGLSLPLPLAVSLIQDNNGEIDINLPIKGNLSDPDFKYGSVVISAFVNVLTKAATSPFKLLASLAGSDQDLSSIEFSAGQSDLLDAETQKITNIADAMNKRSGLKLSIAGQTLQQDTLYFKQSAWHQQLRRDNVQANTLEPAYQNYLAQQAKQAVPNNAEETSALETQLIQSQQIQTASLTKLAHQRAINTRKQLIKMGIDEKRLFVRESQLNQTSERLDGVKLEVK